MINRTAKAGNLFYQTTTEEAVFIGSRKKNGFNMIRQGLVSMSHLQLHFKV